MTRYLAYSVSLHTLGLGALVAAATFLGRPPEVVYSVDLLTSMASGPSPAPAPPVAERIESKEPPAPVRPEPKATPKEAIRLPEKSPRKVIPQPAPVAAPRKKPALPSWATADNPVTEESSTGNAGAASAAVSAKAGVPFPFPWYLKTVSDRLEKNWRPPESFSSQTSCQVSFIIARNGQISDARVSKASGDPFFDQLAMRAVLYANPMPPLPSGFPEPSLRVHMTFEGKPS